MTVPTDKRSIQRKRPQRFYSRLPLCASDDPRTFVQQVVSRRPLQPRRGGGYVDRQAALQISELCREEYAEKDRARCGRFRGL